MKKSHAIINEYFKYLHNIVCGKRYAKEVSFKKLLMFLHGVEFRYSLSHDRARAMDGVDLRWRFAHTYYPDDECRDIVYILDGPCSILEMMIALALRCEETIMDDPSYGDRTAQWFWGMIVNLGLGAMTDERFDKKLAIDCVERFLDRDYAPNGKGGLFTVRNTQSDLRDLEIWDQLCLYLGNIT